MTVPLQVTSEFPAPPEAVWAVFDSEEYQAKLRAQSGLLKTVLEEREEGGIVHRRTKVEREKPLPKIFAKALGSDRLTYFQVDRFDAQTNTLEWRVEVPAMGERLSVGGVTRMEVIPTGSRRVLRGEVTVKIPVLGKRMEKAVAEDFQASAERAVALVRSLL